MPWAQRKGRRQRTGSCESLKFKKLKEKTAKLTRDRVKFPLGLRRATVHQQETLGIYTGI
ncbi:hypothetical protein Aam_060_024 [Acidocella aminolytica 101 = DSM 11237]|uniref:Uncharacterized protein n=1 Tax=Acidocella aminolytica 101 = DSM 11237 TaxID=1120923 RepID=A0A0D6PHX0_9PROT|nr:hypothetical protein Aam_060_024 [Acidocella aminolytica 101 = DSM 11237]